MNEAELGYLAGIIDGEGCISFSRSHSGNKYIHPTLQIANTDRRLFDWIEGRLPKVPLVQHVNPKKPQHKHSFHMVWSGWEAMKVIVMVYPYLVMKKDRAKLVMEFWSLNEHAKGGSGKAFGRSNPIPEWLATKRLEYYNEMKKPNKKGAYDPGSLN